MVTSRTLKMKNTQKTLKKNIKYSILYVCYNKCVLMPEKNVYTGTLRMSKYIKFMFGQLFA